MGSKCNKGCEENNFRLSKQNKTHTPRTSAELKVIPLFGIILKSPVTTAKGK
jgi:hypothetical protein